MDCQGIHILFCDHDPDSGSKTLELLHRCSYKVTVAKTTREVMETVQSENSDVDIVLSDMELPQEKGFKMLKHIMRKEELNRIAVVVMSDRDEMSIVAKCLQLGAVDFLVKPLRLNEVMNLWTHMWRKRKMLGLPDKHAEIHIVKQPKESGRTSNFLSTRIKEHVVMECPSADYQPREELHPRLELSLRLSSACDSGKLSNQPLNSATVICPPCKDVRRSSAFSAYTRPSNKLPSEQSANACSPSLRSCSSLNGKAPFDFRDSLGLVNAPFTSEAYYESARDSSMVDENRPGDMENIMSDASPTDLLPVGNGAAASERVVDSEQNHYSEHQYQSEQNHHSQHQYQLSHGFALQDDCTANMERTAFVSPSPTGSSQASMQQTSTFYHESVNMINVPDSQSNVYAYYPVGHMVMPQFMGYSGWPAMVGGGPMVGGKLMQAERREAALHKFRMKRKGRCFEKRIRYVSRKKLAEQRPRVRGQFVKRTVATSLTENTVIQGQYADEGGEADDEQGCSEMDNHSSPDFMNGVAPG